MNTVIMVVTMVLLVAASVLTLLAALGLLRFNTVYARSHPVTKAITLGMVAVCVAAAIQVPAGRDTLKLLLVAAFQVVTAPIAAHMVTRAAHRTGDWPTKQLAVDELRDARTNDDNNLNAG